MDVGEEIHQSQKTLMKSSAHHSGEGVGLVAVCDMGTGSDMDRAGKDWDGTGEWYFDKNGGWGLQVDFGIQIPKPNSGAGYRVAS